MWIDQLKGCDLDSCTFSKGSYSFEFSKMEHGSYFHFSVASSYNVSFPNIDSAKTDDVRDNISTHIWDMLEHVLTRLEYLEDDQACYFEFDNGGIIKVWAPEPQEDNLIIVKNIETGDWGTIG